MNFLYLSPFSRLKNVIITIPSSKSESNRCLILQAISKEKIQLCSLSSARDTQTLIHLLQSEDKVLNVLDAGTTMRFLTAYCTLKGRKCILTGTERMKNRPNKLLVEALKILGGDISYLEKEGYPPIEIRSFTQKKNRISLSGNVSSQYISALLLVAPLLSKGITIQLKNQVLSSPYIWMTIHLLKKFGVNTRWEKDEISIPPQKLRGGSYVVGPDWSSASYWYGFLSSCPEGELFLENFYPHSIQGDSQIVEIMNDLGVATRYEEKGMVLSKKNHSHSFEYDFSKVPDLALSVAVVCAIKGIKAKLTGLYTLPLKECNRLEALQNELKKIHIQATIKDNHTLFIEGKPQWKKNITIHTYQDHRMAMAFAPLCNKIPLYIENPSVVEKSYPTFWADMEKVGVPMTYLKIDRPNYEKPGYQKIFYSFSFLKIR